ncbi:MAG TPA: hypothetical protein VGP79_05730 [Bryobacteraceae bacterium]|nr:hypothetical protein [Bryobacteraceae bacterium]
MFSSRFASLFLVGCGSLVLAQTPQIAPGGVVNIASFQTALAPGSQAAVFGSNLGPNGVAARPTDPSITVGGRPAYVYFASGAQVNFQVPVELAPGPTTLVLTYQSRSSAPYALTLLPYAPSILTINGSGTGAGAFQHANGTLVGQAPAQPGETIVCSLTGLGATNPPVSTGQITPGSPLSITVVIPTVTVGGKNAQVQFAGLAPGSVGAYQLNFTVPGDLAPGLYNVVISSGGVPSAPVLLPVAITGVILDRTGITFDATAGGPAPPVAQVAAFVSVPRQTAFVTATATTTTGGNWLTATLANGSTFLSSFFNISVNPAALAPGVYYGQVKFSTPDAANSPQSATIVLRVAAPASPPVPVVDPTGVIFLDVAGSTKVSSQTVTLTNVGTQAVNFTAATTSTTAPNPFSVPSTTGTLAPGQPLRFTVQANTTVPTAGGIGAGSYRGTLTFTFPQGTRSVDLLFVATPAGTSIIPTGMAPSIKVWETARQAGTCKPVKLSPVFRALGTGFTAPVGWPAIVEINVIDDCGTPMATGSVVASFSNGDAPLSLVGDGAGKWSATWTPINSTNRATTVTALASQPDVNISGQATISGTVADNPNVPVISPGGVVDAASFNAASTPSPGQIVSVFGGQFASGLTSAAALPLPIDLQGTGLVIGGRSVPLILVSPGQINAVLPYGLTTTSPTQMVAIRGNTISTPVPVSVVAGAPGVFATDGTGRGQGHVYVATGGAGTLADSKRPLKPGDVITIYCGGLGEVDVPVEAGTATPIDKLRNSKNAVTLTIGGVRASVAFAGLTPGASGLYQVNATVPQGVPSGAAVPVVLTIGAVLSLPVTVAVQ